MVIFLFGKDVPAVVALKKQIKDNRSKVLEENDLSVQEERLKLHYEWKGKIKVIATTPVKDKRDLSLPYKPGVAEL